MTAQVAAGETGDFAQTDLAAVGHEITEVKTTYEEMMGEFTLLVLNIP